MSRFRFLIVPGYLVGLLLTLLPLFGVLMQTFPPRPGDVTWRFTTAGLYGGVLLTPLLGVFLLFALALLAEHRGVMRVLAVTNAAVVVGCLIAIGLFSLDLLQIRATVPTAGKARFALAGLTTAGQYAAAGFVSAILAVQAWRAARPLPGARNVKGAESPGLLIRAE
jgi:hypothetical protein